MQSGATTKDFQSGIESPQPGPTTQIDSQADTQTTLPYPPISSAREMCGACGVRLTPDQRYCVECGQRRGPLRVPSLEQLAPRLEVAPVSHSQRKPRRWPVSATLIAGVGTLIVAMGVGVLIGRSSNSEKAVPPLQIVTVGGTSGGIGAGSTTTPSASTETTKATTPGTPDNSSKASPTSGVAKSSKSASKSSKPQSKVVKIGSKGSGAGYNKKHEFTGEFFGGEE